MTAANSKRDAFTTRGASCPGCGSPMVRGSAPIWEDYCSNAACTYARDQMFARIREHQRELDEQRRLEAAAVEAIKVIATFPITDPANQDAHNMALIARNALHPAEGG